MQFLGPLGALVLALVVLWLVWRAFSTGLVRVGTQVDAQIAAEAKEHEQQITDCKKERDWWRNVALEALGVGERLARQRLGGPDV